jgi:hypothetical protein
MTAHPITINTPKENSRIVSPIEIHNGDRTQIHDQSILSVNLSTIKISVNMTPILGIEQFKVVF